jgi:hypothetical protein
MLTIPSKTFRISYCFVLFGSIFPFGLVSSGWVSLARGSSLVAAIPLFGIFIFLILGGYRIYLVLKHPATLSSPPISGFSGIIKNISTGAIYIGVVATVLSWIGRPLMRTLMTSHTESGAEYFMAGLILSFFTSIGLFGLFIFEFSRLLAFERLARLRLATKKER